MNDRTTPQGRDEVIRLEGVWKSFGSLEVLRGIDLSIRRGEVTVILGPSGSGKSVLLKHVLGLIRPDRGRVYFAGEPIDGLDERQLGPIRQRMGFLFQGGALFDSMTVEQNICFPLSEHGRGSEEQWKRRCHEVLSLVGLDGLQDRFPENLSGGQKKRVALARAMVLGPEVMLYDEPTTGLDPVRADLINELILRLNRSLETTSVVVTHDLASARKVAGRVLMLYNGRFVADTTPDEMEHVENEAFQRFIRGQASREELQQLRSGRSEAMTDREEP
jgi:phospholipid/cholesterol/gamma-HCH transport system ATP-binding protein